MDRELVAVIGIFDDAALFSKYRVKATFTDLVLGGVPQKPEIIEAWIRQRLNITSERTELLHMMAATLTDLGVDVDADATDEEIIESSRKVADLRNGNTFRRDVDGLFLAAYQVKAMLKEATNILFAGERWGITKKGPKSFLAERVFVDEQRIHLGRNDPDGTLTQIGHVNGPKGPRSTLTYIDYCVQPEISFNVSSLNDCITKEQWSQILGHSQRLGLGALRSMGHGQFRVTAFDLA